MRPRKTWEGSCGPLPYQTREQPKTIVRNLTHTTGWGFTGGGLAPAYLSSEYKIARKPTIFRVLHSTFFRRVVVSCYETPFSAFLLRSQMIHPQKELNAEAQAALARATAAYRWRTIQSIGRDCPTNWACSVL